MIHTEIIDLTACSTLCNYIATIVGQRGPGTNHGHVGVFQYGIVFDLHVCIYDLEQAEPHSGFGITVDDSDIMILEIIEYDVYDTHVPTMKHKVMTAIQLIKVKIKGINH